MHAADPVWMRALLGVHITAGFSAFVLAPVALITAKGGKLHRRWGMVYLWAMGVVAATALPMALYRPVLFLALVAVFSFYACFSAWRVLALKDLTKGGSAKPIDWAAAGITFTTSASMAGFAIFKPALVQHMGIVAVVFGVIGMSLALGQMRSFVWKPTEKMFWWYSHLGNMIASYIAAWSAFSVTTLSVLLGNSWYVWLWPTMIGVPAIALTTSYYRRKFSPQVKAAM
jgi:uncharacterized membrane protein